MQFTERILQPEDHEGLFAARGLSAVLGLPQRHVGWQVPGPLDCDSHADGPGTVEEGGREPSQPSTVIAQLVCDQRRDFGRSRGRYEQQAETSDEKIVRIPNVTRCETRFAA